MFIHAKPSYVVWFIFKTGEMVENWNNSHHTTPN